MLLVHSLPDLMAIVLEFDLNQPWWLRLARAQTIIPKQVLPMKDADWLRVSATDLNHNRSVNLLTKIWHGWQFMGLKLVWRARNYNHSKVEWALGQSRVPLVSNEKKHPLCTVPFLCYSLTSEPAGLARGDGYRTASNTKKITGDGSKRMPVTSPAHMLMSAGRL